MPSRAASAVPATDITMTLAALKQQVANLEKQVQKAHSTEQRQQPQANRSSQDGRRVNGPAYRNRIPNNPSKPLQRPSPGQVEVYSSIRRMDSMSQASVGPVVLAEIKAMEGVNPSKNKIGGRRNWWNPFRGGSRGNGSSKSMDKQGSKSSIGSIGSKSKGSASGPNKHNTITTTTTTVTTNKGSSSNSNSKRRTSNGNSPKKASAKARRSQGTKPPRGRPEQAPSKSPKHATPHARNGMLSPSQFNVSATSQSSLASSNSRKSNNSANSSPSQRISAGDIHPAKGHRSTPERTPSPRSRNSHDRMSTPLGLEPPSSPRSAASSRDTQSPIFALSPKPYVVVDAVAVPDVSQLSVFGESKQRQTERSGRSQPAPKRQEKERREHDRSPTPSNKSPKSKPRYFVPSHVNNGGADSKNISDAFCHDSNGLSVQDRLRQLEGSPSPKASVSQQKPTASRRTAQPSPSASPNVSSRSELSASSGRSATSGRSHQGNSPTRQVSPKQRNHISGAFRHPQGTKSPAPRPQTSNRTTKNLAASPAKSSAPRVLMPTPSSSICLPTKARAPAVKAPAPTRTPIVKAPAAALGGNPSKAALFAQICNEKPKLKPTTKSPSATPSAVPSSTSNSNQKPLTPSRPGNGAGGGRPGGIGAGVSLFDQIRDKPKLKSVSEQRPIANDPPQTVGGGGGGNPHDFMMANIMAGVQLKKAKKVPKKNPQQQQSDALFANNSTLAALRSRPTHHSRYGRAGKRSVEDDEWTAV